MRNKTYNFILLTLLTISSVSAQYKLVCRFTDPNGLPSRNARLFSSDLNKYFLTDNHGTLTLEFSKQGDVYLEILDDQRYADTLMIININKPLTEKRFRLSAKVHQLQEVKVVYERKGTLGHSKINDLEEDVVYGGMKTDDIDPNEKVGNKTNGNARTTFSQASGITFWQSDGSGVQMDIGGRGLSPKRTSNFNTRQNGYDISADALGYPESYYTPVLEAVDRIHIVRGAAALQFGTQFGGLLDFRLKKGPEDKKLELTLNQSVGNYGFNNTFVSAGGTLKKDSVSAEKSGKNELNYYSYYNYRTGDGWRPNADFDMHTYFASVTYRFSKKFWVDFDYTYRHYLAHQPGGLTDSQYQDDARQSFRERNYFKVNWNLANVKLHYKPNKRTTITTSTFGLISDRASLGNLTRTDRLDQNLERNMILGEFKNIGNETRFVHKDSIGNWNNIFAGGIRLYKGSTRNTQGISTLGDLPDFRYTKPDTLDSDYNNPSKNFSAFFQDLLYLNEQWAVVPGYRFEYISTASEGYYNNFIRDQSGAIRSVEHIDAPKSSERTISLYGVGVSYKPYIQKENDTTAASKTRLEYYGNITRNYRSITFSDLRIKNPNFVIDSNLKDEKGFNADLGVRGNLHKYLEIDASIFYLYYANRIGEVQEGLYRKRTNVGTSRNYGIEFLLQTDLSKMFLGDSVKYDLYLFTNVSYINARYISSNVVGVEGNLVEHVPPINVILGLDYRKGDRAKKGQFEVSLQYTYVHQQFSDANNTIDGTAFGGVLGLIPSYYVMDLGVGYSIKRYSFELNISNLTNNTYFTRRAESYPGPGIIPADGITIVGTLGIKL